MLQVAGALFDVGLLGYTYLTLSLNILNLNEVLKQLSLRHLHTHTHTNSKITLIHVLLKSFKCNSINI